MAEEQKQFHHRSQRRDALRTASHRMPNDYLHGVPFQRVPLQVPEVLQPSETILEICCVLDGL